MASVCPVFFQTLIQHAALFSNINTALDAYSTWLTRGQHVMQPA